MKRLLFAAIFCGLHSQFLFSQLTCQYALCNNCQANPPTYHAIQPFNTSDIVSDYGMRIVGTGSRFHQGIDYAQPAGSAIVSLARGRIVLISESTSGTSPNIRRLKKIVIDGRFDQNNQPIQGGVIFSYLHIFDNNQAINILRSGGFVIMSLTQYNNELVIINLATNVAICQTDGLIFNYNNQQYVTSNFVEADQMIAPIGYSGLPGGPHLHLSLLEYGISDRDINASIDPWNEVNHLDNPLGTRMRRRDLINFATSQCEFINVGTPNWQTFIPDYTNDSRNVLEAEVSMSTITTNPPTPVAAVAPLDRYNNAVMNESTVSWEIQQVGISNSYVPIQGMDCTSLYTIDPIGLNKSIYPSQMFNGNEPQENTNRGKYGGVDIGRNGCVPFAYRSNGDGGFAMVPEHPSGHPHDYYFFPDFYLRIHKNHQLGQPIQLTQYPWNARYFDGAHKIKSKVSNVDGDIYESDVVDFNIDNFKPFIYGAQVYFSSGVVENGQSKPAYERYWQPAGNSGKIKLGLLATSGVSGQQNPGDITVYALTSERMKDITAAIPGLFPSMAGEKDDTYISTDGGERYIFEFGASLNVQNSTLYQIEFEGHDLSNNTLLAYQTSLGCLSPSITKIVPYRNSATGWSNNDPQGIDRVHFFQSKGCGPLRGPQDMQGCISLEEVAAKTNFADAGQSTGSIILTLSSPHPNAAFTWTDENGNIISTDQNLEQVPVGTYCVVVNEDCCTVCGCFEVGECQTEVIPQLTHPTAAGPNGGAIHLSVSDGEEPYTYQWANGQTGADLSGLPVGSYCVTVTDANGCEAVACPELIVCPSIFVNPSLVIEKPSSCTAQDGYIKVNSYGISGPYLASYDITFQSESGQVFEPNIYGRYEGLASGIYTLTATDQSTGCTGAQNIPVLSDYYPQELTATIQPACEGTPNGKAGVAALDGLGGTYTFEWQNSNEGVVTEIDGLFSELSGMYEGNYCVTISSDLGACVVEKCYDIPGVAPVSPLSASANVTHPCAKDKNGAIYVTVSGGIAPYTFDWNDVNDPGQETEVRTALYAGNYIVTVTDYCGVTLTLSFELSTLEIGAIVFTPGCENAGAAAVTAIGGSLPYTYHWKNGATTPVLQGLESGEYCLTVTDAGGCSVEACTRGANKNARVSDIMRPCIHLGQTGSITFEIYNPDNEVVNIYNEAQLVSSQSTGGVFSYTLDNLSHSFNYHIDIYIGDCLNSFTERIQSQPLTSLYNRYEENTGCIYDMYCNGELIAGEGYSSPPTLALANATSFPCEVERFCGGNSLGWVSFSKQKVRAYEYLMILYGAEAAGFNSTYTSQLIDTYFDKDLKNCDFVRYCPATLEITSASNPINVVNGNGTVTNINSNCDRLECGLFYDEVLCTSDIVPEIWNPNNINLVYCAPRRYNVWQLMTWWPELVETYDGFEETELGQKIQELSDIYYGITPTSVEPLSVTCMFITFCSSDFTVLNTTDINSVICWDSQNPDLLGCSYSGEPYNVVVCINPTTLTNYIVPIKQEFSGNLLVSQGGAGSAHVFTSVTESKDHFDKFGYIVNEGVVTPKGIFETSNGEKKFVDYTYRSMFLKRKNAPKLVFYSDDWDHNELIVIAQTANESFSINFEGEEKLWQKDLTATGYLQMTDMKKSTDEILILGWFKGALTINDSLICTTSDSAGYLLHIGTDGLINKFNAIQNLSTTSELTIKKSNDKYIVSGSSKSDWIAVDNMAPITISDTKLFEISNLGGTIYEKKDNEIQTDGNIRLLKSVSSIDQTSTTMLLGGQGRIITTDETYKLNGKTLVLITIDSTGAIEWVKPIYSITSDKEIDVTYGDSSNLYFAVSFQDTLTIEDATFVSHGMKDIFIGKISPNGSLLAVNQYGSDEDELVKQCFFDKGMLYLGGDYSGLNETRTIGKKEFVKIGNNEDQDITKAYISYLTDDDLYPVSSLRASSEPNRQIWVSPNPFSDVVTIRMDCSREGLVQVKLLDAMGKALRIQRETVSLGNNTVYINRLNDIPSGVYFIQVINTDGKKWNQRLIKN